MVARLACSLMTPGRDAIGSHRPRHAFGSSSGRWYALVVLALAWLNPPAAAADEPRSGDSAQARVEAVREFDIPSQPLADALQAFGETTGLAVLIDSRLLVGLESSPVAGRYRQREALQLMLAGTGLAPRYVEEGAFTLVPTDAVSPGAATAHAALASTAGSAAARARSARVIQRSLEQALCASTLARPGRYRAGVRFWLDQGDRIRQPELFESSGDARRDAEIVRRLAGLPLRGLPSGVPQPVVLLLLPESDTSTPPCTRSR